MVATYRKKPVTIEAVQWTGANRDEMDAWMADAFNWEAGFLASEPQIYVAANDAYLTIKPGDWVAKDRHGFYPIKDDVFRESYDLVTP
jgi:hypothetical protein